MKIKILLALSLWTCAFTFSNNAQEKCSIKEESSCTSRMEDGSYLFHSVPLLDEENALKAQLSAYHELKEKLKKNPQLKIFIKSKNQPDEYNRIVRKKLESFLAKTKDPETITILKNLIRSPQTASKLALSLRDPLKSKLLSAVPLSRFHLVERKYTEASFAMLKDSFPHELKPEEKLSKQQKSLMLEYEALAILIAQGFAKEVFPK